MDIMDIRVDFQFLNIQSLIVTFYVTVLILWLKSLSNKLPFF